MLITNAHWLTAEGHFEEGNIRIDEGRIVELSPRLNRQGDEPEIDARGYLLLPGMIDPHVHFREPGQLAKEGIRNGSRAALKGGVTTVIDMPNNRPPVTTPTRLKEKLRKFARKSLVNYGLMFHASSKLYEIDGLAKSLKIFMARSSSLSSVTDVPTLKRLFAHYPRVSIHAEDETAFVQATEADVPHHERRPRAAITRAWDKIEQALKALPTEKRPRVIICHVSTVEDLERIKRLKNEGFDIWAETAPHYVFFTEQDYLREGPLLQVNPPIRTEQDRLGLRQALREGLIDFIGTDHAPHLPAEKQSANPPSGIAGIEWVLPLLLNLIDDGTIDWKQLHELTCGNASRCYDIKDRDGIKIGNRADLVFVKRSDDATLNRQIVTRAAVHVYAKIGCCWHVERTMVNGVVKYEKGKFVNEEPGKAV